MPGTEFLNPPAMPPTNGYSHAAITPAGGRLLWTSGQVPIGPDGTLVAGDWAGQTRAVMTNIGIALEAAGAGWDDVFKLTIFVVDTSALATVRAVRDEFVNVGRPPTSSLVQVAGLFRPGILIEIEAVAALPG